jgi:hypothetical protein
VHTMLLCYTDSGSRGVIMARKQRCITISGAGEEIKVCLLGQDEHRVVPKVLFSLEAELIGCE